MENKKTKLIINSAIPYLFGFLFFENLSSEIELKIAQETSTAQTNKNKTDQPSDAVKILTVSGADKTLFYQHTSTNSETLELLYYDERGQIDWSYKKIKETKGFLVERFNRSSKLIESYEIQNNVKNGEYKQFDNNGNLCQKGTFINGVKSGIWSFFSCDEKIGETKYQDGHPASFEKKFPDGALEIKVELDSIGKGFGKIFFKNGQVQLEGNYINFKKVNSWKIYSSTGKILSEIQYNLFGEKQKVMTYYENQAKHFEVPFKGNLINGKVLEFYFNANLVD
jgi:antitoxin component YwqK of YwqJK toxin-antitoxin module